MIRPEIIGCFIIAIVIIDFIWFNDSIGWNIKGKIKTIVITVIFGIIAAFVGLVVYQGQKKPPIPPEEIISSQAGNVLLGGEEALQPTQPAEKLPVISTDYCYLLLISPNTYRPGVNNIGDVVGVFPANQPFTHGEKTGFNIVKISGLNREQQEAELQKMLPDTTGWTEEKIKTDLTQSKYRFNVQIDKYKNIKVISSNVKVIVK